MNLRKKGLFAAILAALFLAATGIAAAQEHGEHGVAVGEPHPAGGHHGLAAINWTDIFDKERPAVIALFINFGLLAGLYYTLGKKPIAEALKQRRASIAKDIDDARKRFEEAEGRAKKYQADLKNSDADAETARAALVSAGKGEAERILADAKEKAERMKRDAERLVDQERKQIEVDLHRETVERSVLEAMKLLERSVTAEDHARLAQDLLAELGRRPAARTGGSLQPPQGGAS